MWGSGWGESFPGTTRGLWWCLLWDPSMALSLFLFYLGILVWFSGLVQDGGDPDCAAL